MAERDHHRRDGAAVSDQEAAATEDAQGAAASEPGPTTDDRRQATEGQSPPPGVDLGDPPVRAAEEQIEPVGEEASEERRVEHDLDELVAKAGKADEYLALAQRTQADFENYRRRMAREATAAEGRGVARLARELLPALDNLALALAAAEAHAEQGGAGELTQGVRLVQAELAAALARAGIESYSPEGERFDPAEHEAMAQQPVPGAEPGTVVQVYQRGYRINGTVLRPARVVVAA
jgi:molecular chaperone GrpE